MIEMKTARLGDLEFRYAESPGPNPPILLLHGATDSLESYLARRLDSVPYAGYPPVVVIMKAALGKYPAPEKDASKPCTPLLDPTVVTWWRL